MRGQASGASGAPGAMTPGGAEAPPIDVPPPEPASPVDGAGPLEPGADPGGVDAGVLSDDELAALTGGPGADARGGAAGTGDEPETGDDADAPNGSDAHPFAGLGAGPSDGGDGAAAERTPEELAALQAELSSAIREIDSEARRELPDLPPSRLAEGTGAGGDDADAGPAERVAAVEPTAEPEPEPAGEESLGPEADAGTEEAMEPEIVSEAEPEPGAVSGAEGVSGAEPGPGAVDDAEPEAMGAGEAGDRPEASVEAELAAAVASVADASIDTEPGGIDDLDQELARLASEGLDGVIHAADEDHDGLEGFLDDAAPAPEPAPVDEHETLPPPAAGMRPPPPRPAAKPAAAPAGGGPGAAAGKKSKAKAPRADGLPPRWPVIPPRPDWPEVKSRWRPLIVAWRYARWAVPPVAVWVWAWTVVLAQRGWTLARPGVIKLLEKANKPLERLDPKVRSLVGWVGAYTAFLAACLWGFVLFVREPTIPVAEREPVTLTAPGEGGANVASVGTD